MGIRFEAGWRHTVLRSHIRELQGPGGLAREVMALGTLGQEQENPWESLEAFLYGGGDNCPLAYVNVEYDGPITGRPENPTLSNWIQRKAFEENRRLLLVSGRTGSGKTTTCMRAAVDMLFGRAPFSPAPRPVVWVTQYDFLYEEDPKGQLHRFSKQFDYNGCHFHYWPPTVFFFDLDRAKGDHRARLAEFISGFASRAGVGEALSHVCVVAVRSETRDHMYKQLGALTAAVQFTAKELVAVVRAILGQAIPSKKLEKTGERLTS